MMLHLGILAAGTRSANATVPPGCIQLPRPPLVVAASGRLALSVAARWADTWNCVCGDDELEAAERILTDKTSVLNDSCDRAGRDPQTLRRSLLLWRTGGTNPWSHPSALLEIVERFRPLGFSDFIAFHPPAERYDIFDHVTTAALPELRNETTTIE